MIIKTSEGELLNYLRDESNLSGNCEKVFIPENESEIVTAINEAVRDNKPLTISGAGTGIVGGRVPEGGYVISMEKLNNIIEINAEEKYAIVEPGVVLSDFLKAVNETGLLYPPDPTELSSFIGGNVATNASGEKSFKYGPTRNYVLELEVYLSDGEKLILKRGENTTKTGLITIKSVSGKVYNILIPDIEMPDTKNTSGYYLMKEMDAIDLFIGSEGTLGVISKIKLLLVNKPQRTISCVSFFTNELFALSFINNARSISAHSEKLNDMKSINALAVEFMDSYSLKLIKEKYPAIPNEAEAAVWFEQETKEEFEEEVLLKWNELAKKYFAIEDKTWVAFNEQEASEMKQFRHTISEKVNAIIARNGIRKLGTDCAVPARYFNEFYFYCKTEADNSDIDYVVYGHFGDCHIHLNFLPKSKAEVLKAQNIFQNFCNKVIKYKGTISAEHGIGKIKKQYLLKMYGEDAINGMKEVKKALDDKMILGTGNIF